MSPFCLESDGAPIATRCSRPLNAISPIPNVFVSARALRMIERALA